MKVLEEARRLAGGHLGHLLRHPRIVPRLVKDYLYLAAGRERLRGVELAVTYRCQCRCRHCLRTGLMDHPRPELDLCELRQVMGDLHRLGVLNINLTGGEPLMRQDLPQIIQAARPRRTIVTVATNGVLLDRRNVQMMRRLGVAGLAVSIDSPNGRQHDRQRRLRGCHAMMLQGVERALDAGLVVNWVTILTRRCLADGSIHRLVRMADRPNVTLTLNLPYPVGSWAGRADLLLGPDELRQFNALLRVPHVRWEGSSNFFREGCPAGGEKIYITPYGEVMPCAVIHRSFGNVRHHSLGQIHRLMCRTPPYDRHRPRCLVGEPGSQSKEAST